MRALFPALPLPSMVKLNTLVIKRPRLTFRKWNSLIARNIGQRKDALLFGAVIERTKAADLLQPPHTVERVEIFRVTRGQLRRLEITTAHVLVVVGAGIFGSEEVKAQPATIGARDALGLSEEGDK